MASMRLLLADDDADLRRVLSTVLAGEGWEVVAEARFDAALRRALFEPFDVLLCGVRLDGQEGGEFVRRFVTDGGLAPVVMLSPFGAEDAALAAMRDGAYDWLSVPVRADEVLHVVKKAEERERLRVELQQLRTELGPELVRDVVVAESRQMRELLDLTARVARHATTVLISGESGTGKEVLARAIHRMSARARGPFVAVNCAAIPEALLESELFGHVRGAFPSATSDRVGLFETAHGGTLLLDEIGDLAPALQAKLLRVLEDGQIRRVGAREGKSVDVRVIAATAAPLEDAVERGAFRPDLFLRLDVVRVRIAPLRERPEDVPALLAHFARQAERRIGRPVRFAPAAMERLVQYAWPGNVRELRNAVERAAVLGGDQPLGPEAFMLGGSEPAPAAAMLPGSEAGQTAAAAPHGTTLDLKTHVAGVERDLIRRALERAHGSRREAADLLGVSLRTLFYKMRRYRLDRGERGVVPY